MDDEEKPIIEFFDKDMPYFEFSNFSRHGFNLEGRHWPTVEHYYQAAKFIEEQNREQIRLASSPRKAKDLGRSLKPLREGWADIKEQVMLDALRAKFQDQTLRQRLLNTGNRLLVEASPIDTYWGEGKNGKGLNRLGILLMRVRDEMRRESL